MASGHRFELLDGQNYGAGGTDSINPYFYVQDTGTGHGAQNLLNEWIATVLPKILAVQSGVMIHGIVACRNLDVPTDYASTVLAANNVGVRGGECLPPFVAWYLRYGRTRTDMNHGGKRIAGISENDQANGVIVTVNLGTAMTDLAGILGWTLAPAAGGTFRPVIMRRLLGPTGALIGYQAFDTNGVSYVRISTQNSRK